ncbi:glycosyltransferase [Clostridium subterminale]
MNAIYEAMLFFVLPSYKEGFGVVYIEAMAQEKVVIGCKG